MQVDVAIVGGGPAGLAAAREIGAKGGSVIVIDDHPKPGGKLLGQLHEESKNGGWWKGYEQAERLVKEALAANVTILSGKQVWTMEKGWKLFVSDVHNQGTDGFTIKAEAILLATGAVEKPIPIPGWTLPGVMTIGAAQVLTNVYQIKPGHKVAVAGIDILSLSIARAMKLAGVDVIGIFMLPRNEFSQELAVPYRLLDTFKSFTHHAPSPLLRLGGRLLKTKIGRKLAAAFYPARGLKVWDIPVHFRRAILAVEGGRQAEHVLIANVDSQGNPSGYSYKEQIDAVCISGGLSPLYELAVSTGCQFVRLEGLSGVVPLHNETMETKVENLFVAGNITGIEGAKVALAQGMLAGKSICLKLGIGLVGNHEINDAVTYVDEVRKNADIQFHPSIIAARHELKRIWEEHHALSL
ncbi:NAD(P)/FAD-dependent oxidoreductase [Bacillus songklensis]|uniref:NAD(P)/FAD-dependent oxidoreductase n=1 Tax=Bacillus songklensis TaxID=1069116 RepID=A0ABV8B9C4_9BACI